MRILTYLRPNQWHCCIDLRSFLYPDSDHSSYFWDPLLRQTRDLLLASSLARSSHLESCSFSPNSQTDCWIWCQDSESFSKGLPSSSIAISRSCQSCQLFCRACSQWSWFRSGVSGSRHSDHCRAPSTFHFQVGHHLPILWIPLRVAWRRSFYYLHLQIYDYKGDLSSTNLRQCWVCQWCECPHQWSYLPPHSLSEVPH